MKRYLAGVAALGVALMPAVAHADPAPPPGPVAPQIAAGCSPELADAMTLLPDEQTYAICRPSGPGLSWAPVQTPFDPHEKWWSYGPPINLHGQGMRNPNVTSGQWTATPQDPATVCRAAQQTVVEAGVLSDPQVAEGRPGQAMAMAFLPKLFYLKLSGNCVWTRN